MTFQHPSIPGRARAILALLLLGCGLLGGGTAQAYDAVTSPSDIPNPLNNATGTPATTSLNDAPNAASLDASLQGNLTAAQQAEIAQGKSTAAIAGGMAVDPYGQASDATIQGNNDQCDQALETAIKQGREAAITAQQFRDSEAFKYAVSGAYAAQCVGKTLEYFEPFWNAVTGAQTSITAAANPALAALNLAAHALLKVIVQQIIQSLNSQICQITNEITSAANSALQNAICLPSGSLGGVFNFSIPALTLPRADTCSGFAISPIGLADLYPSSYGAGGGYTGTGALGPAVTGTSLFHGQPVSGGGGYDVSALSSYTPPGFRYDDAVDDDSFISMKGPLFSNDDAGSTAGTGTSTGTGGGITVTGTGKVCGSGSSDAFLQRLSSHECKGGAGWDCVAGQFVGHYQLGCGALRGCITNSCPDHDPKTYLFLPSCGGSLSGFLSNHAAQTAAATRFETSMWRLVNRRPADVANAIGKTLKYTVYKGHAPNCTAVGTGTTIISQSGLLAAAHLTGQGGAYAVMNAVLNGQQLTNGKYTLDGNCTSAGVYAGAGAGYDITAISGKGCQ